MTYLYAVLGFMAYWATGCALWLALNRKWPQDFDRAARLGVVWAWPFMLAIAAFFGLGFLAEYVLQRPTDWLLDKLGRK